MAKKGAKIWYKAAFSFCKTYYSNWMNWSNDWINEWMIEWMNKQTVKGKLQYCWMLLSFSCIIIWIKIDRIIGEVVKVFYSKEVTVERRKGNLSTKCLVSHPTILFHQLPYLCSNAVKLTKPFQLTFFFNLSWFSAMSKNLSK